MLQSIQMLLSPRSYLFWLLVISALCFALDSITPTFAWTGGRFVTCLIPRACTFGIMRMRIIIATARISPWFSVCGTGCFAPRISLIRKKAPNDSASRAWQTSLARCGNGCFILWGDRES